MQFKQERRDVKKFKTGEVAKNGQPLDGALTEEYWALCSSFLEMMEVKRTQNLKTLSNTKNFDLLFENIKSEVDFDVHCSIGLGRRMPIPQQLKGNFAKAQQLKQSIYSRVVQIWGDNTQEGYEPEALLKVA